VPLQTSTHASLLARLADGADTGAWREFDERYRELLWRFARSRGLQPADADDVAQEVLHALTKRLPTFAYDPAKGRFRDYLKTSAANGVWRKLRELGGAPLATGGDDSPPDVAVSDDGVERAWEAEWRQYHLRLAMARVRSEFSAQDVAAFEAYAAGSRAASDVAATLGLSVDQVYQAKSRILRRLKAVIAEQTADEG
jgi:RNA polymerase sigma-70 factor (ECF subfamily)